MSAASLIAFEGLDQSGKQTQAESLRDTDRAGPRLPAAVVSRLRDAIGAEICKALHGERDYPPDVMQLLYVANRARSGPRIEAWMAEGVVVICDRYIASSIAYGEAHGLDAAWLREIQRFLPPPHLTILLDIAPETAAGRKATAPRPVRARPGAAGPRPRELPPAGGGAGLGAPRRRARRRPRSPPTSFGRSRHDSGCRHRADLAAPAARSTRAHASSVAPVVLTSSTSTIRSPSTAFRARAQTRSATLA